MARKTNRQRVQDFIDLNQTTVIKYGHQHKVFGFKTRDVADALGLTPANLSPILKAIYSDKFDNQVDELTSRLRSIRDRDVLTHGEWARAFGVNRSAISKAMRNIESEEV